MIDVPLFQKLERIQGDWEHIQSRLLALSAGASRAWLEIVYEGVGIIGDLRECLEAAISGTGLEILRVKNCRATARAMQDRAEETLDDLSVEDVFRRCLDARGVPEEEQPELLHAYRETLLSLHEDQAE